MVCSLWPRSRRVTAIESAGCGVRGVCLPPNENVGGDMGPQRRGLMRAPVPVAPWASFEHPRYFDRYASRNGNSQCWANNDVQYGPRSNWQRPNVPSVPQYRSITQQVHPPHGAYGRFPNPHQFHRGPRPFRGQTRPPYLVQRPDYYPNDNQFKQTEMPPKFLEPNEKPFDKSLNDKIDTVKRKLRERKLSENLEHSDLIFSPTEAAVSFKAAERKRIEHTKVSPKVVPAKKYDKKEETGCKHKNSYVTPKANVSKKSQVLRKKILHQLFKMGNNNLRQIVSNPESSDKYNFILTSLIKDRKKALSRELRNVAEKSLQFHNISPDSARGEQIMQDAFLGHLGTMLDTNASLELFNMEPQLIKELSNVLQQDLIYSSNDEVSAINLANVMHEDFYEENDSDLMNIDDGYFNNLESKFDPTSIIMNEAYHEEQSFPSQRTEINHNMDVKYIPQSQSESHFILPLPPPPPPPILPSPPPPPVLTMQQVAADMTGIRLVNLSFLTTNKNQDLTITSEDISDAKNNGAHSQEIIKNFDLAFDKYEISTKKAKDYKSDITQTRSHHKRSNNNATDKNENKHKKTSNKDSLPTVDLSHSPKKSRHDHKFEASTPTVEVVHNLKKNRHDYKTSNEANFPPAEVNPSSKKNRHNHRMNNEGSSTRIEVNPSPKKPRYNHNESKTNPQNKCSSEPNLPSAEVSKNNYIQNDMAALAESKSCGEAMFASIEANKSPKRSKYGHNENLYSAPPNVSSAQKSFKQEDQERNIPNDVNKSLIYKFDKPGVLQDNFNHWTDSNRRSRKNKHKYRSKSFPNANYDNTLNRDVRNQAPIEQLPGPIKIKCEPLDLIDVSNIKIEAQDSPVANENKRCENCSSRDKLKLKKSQGTQYYDFGKTHSSTQVYASLISSKSKGSQCSRQNCKDSGNQTMKVFDASLNTFTTMAITDTSDFSCQVDLKPFKETCNAEVNTIHSSDLNYINEEVTSQSDIMDRMKKIDNDIHLLVQEKFRLYKVMGAKSTVDKSGSKKKVKDLCKPKSKSKTTSTPMNKVKKKSTLIKSAQPKKDEHSEVMKIKKFYSIDANGEIRVHNNMHDMEFLSTNQTSEDYAVNYVDMSGEAIPSGMDVASEEVIVDNCSKPSISNENTSRKTKKVKNKPESNNSKLNIYKSVKNIKKYNLRSCSVILNKMNNNQVQDFVEEFNNHNMNNSSDAFHHDFHDYGDGDYSLCLDSLNSVHFNNFADPDIPTMLENISGNETVNLIDNWDSKLFDNITLSDGLDALNKSGDSDLQVPTEITTTVATTSSWENRAEIPIVMSDHTDSIIALQCVGKNILAASLDGNIYYYCGERGTLLRTIACSGLAVTSLWAQSDLCLVYAGSLDSNLRCFDYERGIELFDAVNIGSAIQSMCHAWDTLYIGTRTGFVIQFDTKSNTVIEDSTIRFSEQAILALEAIKEGPRKVLLIASRSQDVTVKDAKTGLLLRSFRGPNTTVYSLLFDSGNIYCGTSGSDVQVFNFVTGDLIGLHSGGNGAVCLQMYRGLLFAGCYDGIIYVFKPGVQQPLASIPGSGTMLLAMTITDNMIIGGCKDKSLSIWTIPRNILDEMI